MREIHGRAGFGGLSGEGFRRPPADGRGGGIGGAGTVGMKELPPAGPSGAVKSLFSNADCLFWISCSTPETCLIDA